MQTDIKAKQKAEQYLTVLCEEITDRSVGSAGNRQATAFFKERVERLGWSTEVLDFDAMNWREDGAQLSIGPKQWEVLPSPYSPGCDATGPLVNVSTLPELEDADLHQKIVLLHGKIAREQLMPKNFVFYNPESHQRIISLLEQKQPSAIICATEHNGSLAGGVYPFPLIEDGDVDIPSVYTTDDVGEQLLAHAGRNAHLMSHAERIPATGYNVIAHAGGNASNRIVITAHIDAKKGTPGAIDNATGVTVLLLLAELLAGYQGSYHLELVPFNGEDYYAVPGQMAYINHNRDRFDEIALNINIDGAGYLEGPTSVSLFDLPDPMESIARQTIDQYDELAEGSPWPQGDHSIFLQMGCPALAVSSKWLIDHMDSQQITHTVRDNLSIVDSGKLVVAARALASLITTVDRSTDKNRNRT